MKAWLRSVKPFQARCLKICSFKCRSFVTSLHNKFTQPHCERAQCDFLLLQQKVWTKVKGLHQCLRSSLLRLGWNSICFIYNTQQCEEKKVLVSHDYKASLFLLFSDYGTKYHLQQKKKILARKWKQDSFFARMFAVRLSNVIHCTEVSRMHILKPQRTDKNRPHC